MGGNQSIGAGARCLGCGKGYPETRSFSEEDHNQGNVGGSLDAFANILLDVSRAGKREGKSRAGSARSKTFSAPSSKSMNHSEWKCCADTQCALVCCPDCIRVHFVEARLSPDSPSCHVCHAHHRSWSKVLGEKELRAPSSFASSDSSTSYSSSGSTGSIVAMTKGWGISDDSDELKPSRLRVKKLKPRKQSRIRLLSERMRKPKRASSEAVEPLSRHSRMRSDSGGDAHPDNGELSKFWTAREDSCLREAVRVFGGKNWKEIAERVPNRNHVQCLQRWNYVLRPGLVKGSWTQDEDAALVAIVREQQEKKGNDLNWKDIAKKIQGRSGKQCRERWYFNLDPTIKSGPWTPEEDALLLSKQAEFGNKWAFIASLIDGRTENATKMRFKSIMRAKKREWRPEEDTVILHLHDQFGSNWARIAQDLPKRTKNAVMVRYKALLLAAKKKKESAAVLASSAAVLPRQAQKDAIVANTSSPSLLSRKTLLVIPSLARRVSQ